MALQLSSKAFENGGDIPSKYTCDGQDISPPLTISGVPENAASLVLIFEDPDAAREPGGNGKTFDHWLVYNISPIDQEVAEGSLPAGDKQGLNSAGKMQYMGPCPPTFKHQYVFRLLAIDRNMEFDGPPTKQNVEEAIVGHIIEETQLTAYYEKI